MTTETIHTKIFTDNESFVKWQEENNSTVRIINVVPLSHKMTGESTKNELALELTCSIFVTYIKE